MKGQTFLKVTAILMIIGGALAAIVSIIAVLGVSALTVMIGTEGMELLYVSTGIAVLASVIELIAGIKGVIASNAPEKAGACVKWGIMIAALTVISIIVGLIADGEFSVLSFILNLVLPGLYIYAALQLKKGIPVQQ